MSIGNTNFCYAEQVEEVPGTWLVFCPDCSQSFGTMTSETLMKAIENTRYRGGVKCPPCRESSCRCGVNFRWRGVRKYTMKRYDEFQDVCGVCMIEMVGRNRWEIWETHE